MQNYRGKERGVLMSRTIFNFNFTDFDKAEKTINSMLNHNNFHQTIIGSEVVWKRGGIFVGGQCVKFEFGEDYVKVSAWITQFLGGGGEYDLNGISALVPKRQLLTFIEQIRLALM